jgi:hypothetical protein
MILPIENLERKWGICAVKGTGPAFQRARERLQGEGFAEELLSGRPNFGQKGTYKGGTKMDNASQL